MIRSFFRRAAIGTAAMALAVSAVPAGASGTVAIEDATAVADAGTIFVDGDIEFSHDAIVFDDATGDGLSPGSDIGSAEVQILNDRRIAFRVNLADALPEIGSTTVTQYFWELNAGGNDFQLAAMHNNLAQLNPGTWNFSLQTCSPDPDTGQNTCGGDTVSGSYADGVIEWQVNMNSIGVRLGDTINPAGAGVHSTVGAAGLIWFSGDFQDGLAHGPIALPGFDVSVTNTVTGDVTTSLQSRDDFEVSVPGTAGDDVLIGVTFDGATDSTTVTAQ